MHAYLENVGLPYLEDRIVAAKALVDQHAKPSGLARHKFAASETTTLVHDRSGSENGSHRVLEQAYATVKGLQVFVAKRLLRNGLHLVDDMFR